MAFSLEFSPAAQGDLQLLRKFEQTRIVSAIATQLKDEPLTATRHRKQMKSNLIATWELRIGDFRAYYDVDEERELVLIRAVGVKHHNRLFIGGEEVEVP